MVKLTDRPDMTLDVYRRRKTTMQNSNAKTELELLEWTSRLCLRFVLYDMRLVNIYHCHV